MKGNHDHPQRTAQQHRGFRERDMSGAATKRLEWLRKRQSGIGGSDIAALLGLSPWSTPFAVWESKVQPIADDADDAGSEAMYWGTVLEDVVAREYAKRAGVTVQRVNADMRQPGRPWLMANVDRAIVAPKSRARFNARTGRLEGAAGLLEVKTASAYAAAEWEGADGSDAMPVYYAAQCMYYLGVTGQEVCDVAVLIGGSNYQWRRIVRDEATIAAMFEAATEFWHTYVVTKEPPPPTCAADMARLFPRDDGALLKIDADPELVGMVDRLRALRLEVDTCSTEAERLADALKMRIGAHAGLSFEGQPVVTWKASKDSARTDWKAVVASAGIEAERLKELVAQATTIAPGTRRFIVK